MVGTDGQQDGKIVRQDGQQWTATGTGALAAADLGMAYNLLEEVTINPPESSQNLHRTGK